LKVLEWILCGIH